MFTVTKRIEIAAAHKLELPYDSPCSGLHGHNWWVEVTVEGPVLNEAGMVIDFCHIRDVVKRLDHSGKLLNDIIKMNPTAENIAFWIAKEIGKSIANWCGPLMEDDEGTVYGDDDNPIPRVIKVQVIESEGNIACYTR
jgi:6-pyruvoyltetrahydropterin/6-carboxytetrahydropterin synthase